MTMDISVARQSARLESRTDRRFFKLLTVLTYGLFLVAAIVGRMTPERYGNVSRISRPSVFREAWDTANSTLAFAFNLR